MATGIVSNYLENRIINHTLRDTYYSPYTSVYLALYTGNPWESGSGPEVSAGSYARKQVTNGFTVETYGVAYNTANIYFTESAENWGTVTHIGVTNASQSGSLLFYTELNDPKTISASMVFMVPIAALRIALGEGTSSYTTIPGIGNYLSYVYLRHILNGVSYAGPMTNLYLCLYRTMPSAADIGGLEVASSDYARIKVDKTFEAPISGSSQNMQQITFTNGAAYEWGVIEGICIRDTSGTSYEGPGTLLYRGFFSSPITVVQGDGLYFSASTIRITVD
jgi:hypothetical protein